MNIYMDYNYNTMLNRIDNISSLIKEEDYKELLNNLLFIKKQNDNLLKYKRIIKHKNNEIESLKKTISDLEDDNSNLEFEMSCMSYN
jgi:predicted RNase H-like nuclease (RuvC/YqgF family)